MCNSTKCGYCGNPVKPEEVVKSTLLYRNGSQLARKEKEYCSERCASYDQMALEA
ncbi:YdaE family protein [Enterobacter mori]|uniref:YdaE family protein n=1 Tax=Enterobacter mori TaxID=539813 RepID=UPI003B83EDE7